MKKGLAYPVNLVEDLGAVRVVFPDWDDTETFGSDREEALAMARDLLEAMVSAHVAKGEVLPDPSPDLGRPTVGLSAISAAKVGLYVTMLDAGLSRAELSRRLGWHFPQVQRVLDLRHKSRMDQIEQALAAVGKRLVVMVHDAA
ncbi:MAG: type II toxin-antitoxin system HicB family antitoxin [Magnetococcales bacterium]|nr:type II toxin-antitoxin system HicB family antitoxin [Magnetococcales bacterium]